MIKKRVIQICITLVCLCTVLALPVDAASSKYFIPELDLTISIPDEYDVFTLNMSSDDKKLLSAMENVNGSNYKSIGMILDKLPAGYEDTGKIRTQYNELKKYISAIESSTFTTRSCDALRTAYVNLNSFNNKYHNWDVSDYLKNGVYKNHFKKLVFGREWTDGTYELHWYEDGDGERLSTNLPNGKKS